MKQHLNQEENTVPEKPKPIPRDPLPPLVNHPAGEAAPGAVDRQTLAHCLPSQQAAARAMLGGSLRGLMYYMDVQAAAGVILHPPEPDSRRSEVVADLLEHRLKLRVESRLDILILGLVDQVGRLIRVLLVIDE